MRTISLLVLTGISASRIDVPLRRRLKNLAPGGIVLFRRNLEGPAQLARLTADLRDTLGPSSLIAVDQEGGRVARLRAPFTEWPPMRRFGEARSPALARAAGRAMGRELAAAGFNCDFAPVLDVDSNPANPVIGDRSFGREPREVARLAIAFARGLEDAGILPCGKHFPGHGDTALDSHLALPEVAKESRELRRCELAPFRRAIRADLPLLMSAHVRYPALDASVPATLSRPILTDLLRTRMGFRGVLVSDDLAMHALDGEGALADVVPRAFMAGCDWLLACQSLDDGEAAAAALQAAVDEGRITQRRLAEATRRIGRIRRLLERRVAPEETLDEVLASGEGRRVLSALDERLRTIERG